MNRPRRSPTVTPTARMTILDAMLLIMAAGVGLAMLRMYLDDLPRAYKVPSHWRTVEYCYGATTIPAACLMPALLAIRLKAPRPRSSRLARQPGFAACVAAVAALAVGALEWGIGQALKLHDQPGWGLASWITVSIRVRPAIAAAWLLLALGRLWRPEPDWVDRAGRALGWLWIAWIAFYAIPLRFREQFVPLF